MNDTQKWNQLLAGKTPGEVLSWAVGQFGANQIALASSLGAEDQVLTDMLVRVDPGVAIFTLDTGRLPQETLDCMKVTEQKYGFKYRVYRPEAAAVDKLVAEKGLDLFYESVENRKLCCHIRKVEPLKRALKGLKAWICGLRREQSVTREGLNVVEWDASNGLYKINPLIEWTEKQVWETIRAKGIPYNRLHDQGYPSIGCAPCTRAVKPGEDVRAGRWWWESPDKKECGLHFKDGKVTRKES
jgi:phosphoadenosine phosphosulfate reductase